MYMAQVDKWVPSITIKAVLEGFETMGLDKAKLLQSINLTQAQIDDPYSAVPNHLFAQLWMTVLQDNPNPAFISQAGLTVPFGAFGLLDHLLKTANTFGEGMHMLNLSFWLVAVDMILEFDHQDDGDWVYILTDPYNPGDFISTHWTAALILNRWSAIFEDFKLLEVQLSQPEQSIEDKHALEEFWQVPVSLGAKKTGLKFPLGVWQLKNQEANPELRKTLQELANRVEIQAFTDAPLSFAIKSRLPEALQAQAFAASDIAEVLGLSKRTLQRKLSHENINFKELLDTYRQEKAMEMLLEGQSSLADVAYSLGYEEQSSFNRAFKRWQNISPSEWLAQQSQTL